MNKPKQEKNKGRAENKWDDAIRDAEEKIERLRAAIRSFKAHKAAGIPWPEEPNEQQHSA